MYSKMNSILLWKKTNRGSLFFNKSLAFFNSIFTITQKKVHCKKLMCNKHSVFLK